jgi:hypothetical protein
VPSGSYNLCSRSAWATGLIVQVSLATSACGQVGTLNPIVINGGQFAHSIQLQSRFRVPENTAGRLPLVFDHYRFRLSKTSPGVLLVAACKEVTVRLQVLEICSLNSFAIDTEHGYATRDAEAGEWEKGTPVTSLEMNDPTRRTVKQEYAKPAFLRALPIAPRPGEEYQGYKYRGNEYLRRGDWIGSLTFGSSEDGTLIVLTGADKRRFPDQRPAFVDAAIYTNPNGLVTVDVFASDPSRRIAAFDLDSHTSVDTARRRISLVNSRWIAIGLAPFLDKMLLFDFKPTGEQPK